MTNDAERVSDIVAELRARSGIGAAIAPTESNPKYLYTVMDEAADIIEAQSKALAEAREAFDEMSRECINGLMNDIMRVEELLRGTKAGANPESMRKHLARCQELAATAIRALTPTPENPNG